MKKCISIVLTAVLLLSLFSCSQTPETKQPAVKEEKHEALNLMAGVQARAVEELATDDAFVQAQMQFAVSLLQNSLAQTPEKNVLVSPLSVMLVMALATNGADGETKAELEAALGGISIEELNRYLYTYVTNLPTAQKYKLNIANSVWMRNNGITIKPEFLQSAADYYNAEVYQDSFDGKTVKLINDWVKKNTDGLIDKVLDSIGLDTYLYLINTLLFDAEWKEPYKKDWISKRNFTSLQGTQNEVEMMYSDEYHYFGDDKAMGFKKPYADEKYSFAALLPNEGVNLTDYVSELTASHLQEMLSSENIARIHAGVPKFESEYDIELSSVLKNMGAQQAFEADEADFSKLANGIYLQDVIHKTFISVDERGTKAGAVTMSGFGAEGEIVYLHTIILDRPFVYMIVDNATNLPLFMGVVTEI